MEEHACDVRLVMLPGLGVDARLFAPQRSLFPRLEVPPWVEPRQRERLADYAARWAATVSAEPPFFLGGVSFGGMVAYLAAGRLKPRAVFLIASCRFGRAIPRHFRVFERVSRVIPDRVLRRLRCPAASFVARLDGTSPDVRRFLCDLASECPIPFQRWAGWAMVDWSRDAARSDPGVPSYQIHGRADRLLPLWDGEPDVVIPDGGHLINLTHADDVNRFLLARTRPA